MRRRHGTAGACGVADGFSQRGNPADFGGLSYEEIAEVVEVSVGQ